MHAIAWSELGATDLFRDFVERFDRVKDLFPVAPGDADAHQRQWERRQAFWTRLQHAPQWHALTEPWHDPDPVSRTTADGLIVTGQQPGLLGGPLFTLYKIWTAVRLAEIWWSRGVAVRAAFWSLDEDHDLAEFLQIASIDDADHPQITPLSEGVRANRRPIGTLTVDHPVVRNAVQFHRRWIRPGLYAQALQQALDRAYGGNHTVDRAFRIFLYAIAPDMRWPLWISARNAALKRRALPLLDQLVARWAVLLPEWRTWMQRLQQRGYHLQLPVHDEYFPMFRIANGARHRLLWRNGRIVCLGTGEQWSVDAFRTWLTDHVTEISPNVALRPILQDYTLPTMVYVAGPAEIAYFAQLRFLYDALDVPMPVLFPRVSLTLVPPPLRRLFKRTRLSVSHCLVRPVETWAPEGAARPDWWEAIEAMAARWQTFQLEITRALERAGLPDPDRWQRALHHVQQAWQRFEGTVAQLWARRSDRWMDQCARIQAWIRPLDRLQERVHHIGVYYQLVGPGVVQALASVDVWRFVHYIVELV